MYGYSLDVLGWVVERASGIPFDQFVRTRITEPLGMKDTFFFIQTGKRARLATVYMRDSAGRLQCAPEGAKGQGHYADGPRRNFAGGAGLLSTAHDYGRFLQMIVNGGELDGVRILAPHTVMLMTNNQLDSLFTKWSPCAGSDSVSRFRSQWGAPTSRRSGRTPGVAPMDRRTWSILGSISSSCPWRIDCRGREMRVGASRISFIRRSSHHQTNSAIKQTACPYGHLYVGSSQESPTNPPDLITACVSPRERGRQARPRGSEYHAEISTSGAGQNVEIPPVDPTEAFAQQYLANLRLGPVVFEPDGNIPPDFVIDGRIAVEVRRLNQIYDNAKKATGLEEEDIPLYLHMRKLLRSFGPPTGPTSLAVSYRFARPLGRWKILESSITNILKQFSTDAPATRTDYKITPTFTLVLTPLSIKLADRFRLTGMSDEDSGGMLLDLMRQSLALVVPEKARKIVPYRDRYREWWLLLVDYIGLGLSDFERDLFQENVRIAHDWNRLLLLSPIDTTRVIEIPR